MNLHQWVTKLQIVSQWGLYFLHGPCSKKVAHPLHTIKWKGKMVRNG